MGMAEEAASLRARIQAPKPSEPRRQDSRLWSAVKRKYREREDRLNEQGLLTWDAVDSAVKEFAPLARQKRGLKTHGNLKPYWRIVLEKRFDPGRFDEEHFRMPREHITLQLKVYRDGSWTLGGADSKKRVPVRSRSAADIRNRLVKFLAHGRDTG